MDNFFLVCSYFSSSQFIGDAISLLLFYSVIKYILIGIVTEMIWPTQLFNKVNLYLNETIRYRSYCEFLAKLTLYSSFYYIIYAFFLNTQNTFKVERSF